MLGSIQWTAFAALAVVHVQTEVITHVLQSIAKQSGCVLGVVGLVQRGSKGGVSFFAITREGARISPIRSQSPTPPPHVSLGAYVVLSLAILQTWRSECPSRGN